MSTHRRDAEIGRHHQSRRGHSAITALAVLALAVLIAPLMSTGAHRKDGRFSTGVTASGITATLPNIAPVEQADRAIEALS